MNIKSIAKAVLPPVVVNLAKKTKEKSLKQAYLRKRKAPWSLGYSFYRKDFILESLSNLSLLKQFRNSASLPSDYGIGIDERCIEYPWLFSQLPSEAKFLLDAGSVLNFDFILDQIDLSSKQLHIMTLAPENNCFWKRGISYLYGDLRNIPIKDEYYDAIVCISTLEHIGLDNTLYTHYQTSREDKTQDFIYAVKELRRVLKPGGVLLLSVPFGTYRNFGSFQQFDRALLDQSIEAFGKAKVIETFYRYTAEGWQIAQAANCAECEYVEWVAKQSWQQSNQPLPVEPDLAAAARAVACVQLIKE